MRSMQAIVSEFFRPKSNSVDWRTAWASLEPWEKVAMARHCPYSRPWFSHRIFDEMVKSPRNEPHFGDSRDLEQYRNLVSTFVEALRARVPGLDGLIPHRYKRGFQVGQLSRILDCLDELSLSFVDERDSCDRLLDLEHYRQAHNQPTHKFLVIFARKALRLRKLQDVNNEERIQDKTLIGIARKNLHPELNKESLVILRNSWNHTQECVDRLTKWNVFRDFVIKHALPVEQVLPQMSFQIVANPQSHQGVAIAGIASILPLIQQKTHVCSFCVKRDDIPNEFTLHEENACPLKYLHTAKRTLVTTEHDNSNKRMRVVTDDARTPSSNLSAAAYSSSAAASSSSAAAYSSSAAAYSSSAAASSSSAAASSSSAAASSSSAAASSSSTATSSATDQEDINDCAAVISTAACAHFVRPCCPLVAGLTPRPTHAVFGVPGGDFTVTLAYDHPVLGTMYELKRSGPSILSFNALATRPDIEVTQSSEDEGLHGTSFRHSSGYTLRGLMKGPNGESGYPFYAIGNGLRPYVRTNTTYFNVVFPKDVPPEENGRSSDVGASSMSRVLATIRRNNDASLNNCAVLFGILAFEHIVTHTCPLVAGLREISIRPTWFKCLTGSLLITRGYSHPIFGMMYVANRNGPSILSLNALVHRNGFRQTNDDGGLCLRHSSGTTLRVHHNGHDYFLMMPGLDQLVNTNAVYSTYVERMKKDD